MAVNNIHRNIFPQTQALDFFLFRYKVNIDAYLANIA